MVELSRHKLVVFASRVLMERLMPPIFIKKIDEPSLEAAQKFNRADQWADALAHYDALSRTNESENEKAKACIEAAQTCINLGRFGQAKPYLDSALGLSPETEDENLIAARVWEKRGWIYDYEGDFKEAIHCFNKASELTNDQDVLSTCNHFRGRAHFGLAAAGIDKRENLQQAQQWFNRDLTRFVESRQQGQPRPANEGFQRAWLCRCKMLGGDLANARVELNLLKILFEEEVRANLKSGIMAHYRLLEGALSINEAREHFEEALKINHGRYPRGEAAALMGIAQTYLAEGKVGAALAYAGNAIKVFPFIIIRP